MKLVEIRDLDGPNLFALEPVIKLEVTMQDEATLGVARQQYIAEHTNHYVSAEPVQALSAVIVALHQHLNLPMPQPTIHELDTPGHVAVCFLWQHRAQARAIAQVALDLVSGERIERLSTHLAQTIEAEADDEEPEGPTWVRDSERRIPSVAVTGTNGKTTTTRLLAHILGHASKRVGWSSSSGVYIDGEQVIEGDYTGHGGARRVLTDPETDVAVLETARGGILLRGLGYESNDVSVFLNVSEDHLNLHGVEHIETLAKVKATVVRTTKADGVAVLNADDPLVFAQKPDVHAEVMLISQYPENPALREHFLDGGRGVILENGIITLVHGSDRDQIIPVADVPLTYGGMARHMVENALAACAAAVGMGLELEQIASAMRTFSTDRTHNAGRLNVFELDQYTVVVDFAHNERGLSFLLDFAKRRFPHASRLTAVVGTAGDRQDSVFVGLGRIASTHADRIIVKSNARYLRGRTHENVVELIREGMREVNESPGDDGAYPSEHAGVVGAIDSAKPGEVIVVMCIEDYASIIEELANRGAFERLPADT